MKRDNTMSIKLLTDDFIDGTLANLKIIGMLQKNDKIKVYKGQICVDRGEESLQPLWRWLNRDSRDVSIVHLRNTVNNAMKIAHSIQTDGATRHVVNMQEWTLRRLVDEMQAAEIGLQNLRATYMCDGNTVAALDVLTERLKANCDEIKERMMAQQQLNSSEDVLIDHAISSE